MKLRLIFSCCLAAIAAAMVGCGATTGGYNLPPASRLMEPGPGVGGPGPGVIGMPTPGVAPAMYASPAMGSGMGSGMVVGSGTDMACANPNGLNGGGLAMGPATEVQVLFAKPQAMQVMFDAGGSYSSTPIITPGRQNFMQGGVYRLKISGITGREGTELYPTLEIGPPTRQTAAYLAHNAIPIQFTEEDFDQVLSGNFVTKVIYLPEPDFQELALAGVETLVSTRLDPGLDPIVEADRRGAILAVIRIGNKDMEVPGGMSVAPTYGSVAPAPAAGVMPANYGAPSGQGLLPAAIQTPVPAPTPAAAGSGIAQASLQTACSCGSGCQAGGGCLAGMFGGQQDFYGPNSTPRGGYGPGGLPPGLMAAGQYGMPITGTPIGLPGPPHVPLGVPAGLKKHTMHNWTHQAIPGPVKHMKINVKQRPGLSYPQPPNRAWVVEDAIHPMPFLGHAGGHDAAANCPDGSCAPASSGGGLLGHMKGLLGH